MSRKLFRTIGLTALVVGMGKMLRFHAWKQVGGLEGKPRFKHWHGPDRHGHRWAVHRQKWHEERTEPAEEDADASAAEGVI